MEQQLVIREEQAGLSLTLRDVVVMGFRHKLLLLLCFFGILVGVVLFVLVWPNYQSQTEFLLRRDRVDPVVTPGQNTPMLVNNAVTEEELNSEVELIKSQDVLSKVVLTCGLDKKPSISDFALGLFGVKTVPEKKTEKAVKKLGTALEIEALPKSNVIKVSYSSNESLLPARVLNALGDAYLEKHKEVHRSSGQFKFFEEETDQYRKKLAEAEVQLKDFPRETQIANPQLARDITLQKMADFKVSLNQTQAAIAETEQRIRALENLTTHTPSRVTTQSRNSDDALILQQLKSTLLTLQLKRVELGNRYKPDYLLVQEVDQQIADTQAAIAKEEAKPLRDVTTDQNPAFSWIASELVKDKADLRGYQAKAAATANIVRENLANVLHLDEQQVAQQDLLRNVKSAEENYLLYLRKREEARITDALDATHILNAAIAEKPVTPLLPAYSPLAVLVMGIVLAGVVSSGVVLTAEYMARSFRTPAEVEGILNLPLLATIPAQVSSSNGNEHNGKGNVKGNGNAIAHNSEMDGTILC